MLDACHFWDYKFMSGFLNDAIKLFDNFEQLDEKYFIDIKSIYYWTHSLQGLEKRPLN